MRRGAWFNLVWTLAGCFVAPGHRRARPRRVAGAVRRRSAGFAGVPRSSTSARRPWLARFGPVAGVWLRRASKPADSARSRHRGFGKALSRRRPRRARARGAPSSRARASRCSRRPARARAAAASPPRAGARRGGGTRARFPAAAQRKARDVPALRPLVPLGDSRELSTAIAARPRRRARALALLRARASASRPTSCVTTRRFRRARVATGRPRSACSATCVRLASRPASSRSRRPLGVCARRGEPRARSRCSRRCALAGRARRRRVLGRDLGVREGRRVGARLSLLGEMEAEGVPPNVISFNAALAACAAGARPDRALASSTRCSSAGCGRTRARWRPRSRRARRAAAGARARAARARAPEFGTAPTCSATARRSACEKGAQPRARSRCSRGWRPGRRAQRGEHWPPSRRARRAASGRALALLERMRARCRADDRHAQRPSPPAARRRVGARARAAARGGRRRS